MPLCLPADFRPRQPGTDTCRLRLVPGDAWRYRTYLFRVLLPDFGPLGAAHRLPCSTTLSSYPYLKGL